MSIIFLNLNSEYSNQIKTNVARKIQMFIQNLKFFNYFENAVVEIYCRKSLFRKFSCFFHGVSLVFSYVISIMEYI